MMHGNAFKLACMNLWVWTVAGIAMVAPVQATPGDTLVVRQGGIELRQAPAPDAAQLGWLAAGRSVIEFERRDGWVRVGVLGAVAMEAWVSLERLAPAEPSEPGAGLRPAPTVRIIRGPGSATPDPPPPAAGGLSDAEGAVLRRFRLHVFGTPALAFAADCELVQASGKSLHRKFSGLVPAQFELSGSAVLCRVRKRDFRGRLKAELAADDQLIAHAETAAAFNHVKLQSSGPWGPAAGVRGAIATPSITLSPGRRGELVPPLRGPITPPLSGPIVPRLGARRR